MIQLKHQHQRDVLGDIKQTSRGYQLPAGEASLDKTICSLGKFFQGIYNRQQQGGLDCLTLNTNNPQRVCLGLIAACILVDVAALLKLRAETDRCQVTRDTPS